MIALLLLSSFGAFAGSGDSPMRFEEIPAQSLPVFSHFNGQVRASVLPEDNGSGCAWGDYDGDGDDDLFLCNMPGPALMDTSARAKLPGSQLWRNDGGRFANVTASAGVVSTDMDMGALFVDYDNDGDEDLLVTHLNGLRLFKNTSGHFNDVTALSGLSSVVGYCLGAAWGDYNRDGLLDLYVCRYVDFPFDKARARPLVAGRPAPMTTPSSYPPLANFLFSQTAEHRFVDTTSGSGTASAKGRSMQALWCDFDNDGWLDLYVANDQSFDKLYKNKRDGSFEDIGTMAGVFDPRGAMGVAVLDLHNDGDQDFLVTHWVSEDPALYVNTIIGEQCLFEDEAIKYGLRKKNTALVGWGLSFEDFDNDGDDDLFVAYGSTIEDELTLEVLSNPKMLPQAGRIYDWDGRRWTSLGKQAGPYFEDKRLGRGAAVSDINGDGRLDIAVLHHGGPPAVLLNKTAPRNWLGIRLTGRHCNRNGANARVTVFAENQPRRMRELFIGSSYLSGNSKVLHFGLADAVAADIEIRWPCGRTQRRSGVRPNQIIHFEEEIK
jgi:hypothetical protein